MKGKDILDGLGLVVLAGLVSIGSAEIAAEKEKREDESLGTINIPSSEMRQLQGKRMILKVEGSDVRKIDPNSFIGTAWLVWGAKFRPYMGKSASRIELDATINSGETVPCYYYSGKSTRAQRGYVTIMETSR